MAVSRQISHTLVARLKARMAGAAQVDGLSDMTKKHHEHRGCDCAPRMRRERTRSRRMRVESFLGGFAWWTGGPADRRTGGPSDWSITATHGGRRAEKGRENTQKVHRGRVGRRSSTDVARESHSSRCAKEASTAGVTRNRGPKGIIS